MAPGTRTSQWPELKSGGFLRILFRGSGLDASQRRRVVGRLGLDDSEKKSYCHRAAEYVANA
jgi:hypothetical protein